MFVGFGSSLTFTVAVTVNAVHFVKYRPLALGISSAGGGVGNMFYSWVSTRLIASLGWRGEPPEIMLLKNLRLGTQKGNQMGMLELGGGVHS